MRLVTLNVWGLPWPASREGSARMRAIGSRLPELAPDIVAFQEVWTEDWRSHLVDSGRRAGLVHAWHNPASLTGSGLLVLSRESFADARFEAFVLRGFPLRIWHGDYHGGKGFCALRFGVPGAGFTLVDTHLHAQYVDDAHDDEQPFRLAQIVQLATAIGAMSEPVVAAGDFNMREGRPEYALFTSLTGMRDAAAELSRRQPTAMRTNPYRIQRSGTNEERIDYVFARDGDGRRVRVRSLARIFDDTPAGGARGYSDHAGLVAEVELESDPAIRAPRPGAAASALAARALAEGRAIAVSRRGEQRVTAAAALAGAGLAAVGARRQTLSRRRLLRAGLGAGALLAAPFGFSNAALAELAVPDEVRGYDLVAARLAELAARGSAS